MRHVSSKQCRVLFIVGHLNCWIAVIWIAVPHVPELLNCWWNLYLPGKVRNWWRFGDFFCGIVVNNDERSFGRYWENTSEEISISKRGNIDEGEENRFEIPKIDFEKVQKLEWNVESQCGTCKSKVGRNQKGVLCEACKWGFHSICIKLSAEEYKIMAKPSSKVTWFCEVCK